MTDTPLDIAHASMEGAPEDDRARLAFYERLAEAELFLLLTGEPTDDSVDPQIFEADDSRFVLVFDRETRLTDFTGQPAPYAALSGRSLAELLAPERLGIGLNLGVAPSSFLMAPEGVAWLAQTLAERPTEVEAAPERVLPPVGLPEDLLRSLDQKLATAQGLASSAYLVVAEYAGGRKGHLLAFIDAVPGAEPALARAASEALIFAGIDAGQLDVAFFRASQPIAASLAKVGLRFDLPQAESMTGPSAPGMDPDKPPRLT